MCYVNEPINAVEATEWHVSITKRNATTRYKNGMHNLLAL